MEIRTKYNIGQMVYITDSFNKPTREQIKGIKLINSDIFYIFPDIYAHNLEKLESEVYENVDQVLESIKKELLEQERKETSYLKDTYEVPKTFWKLPDEQVS